MKTMKVMERAGMKKARFPNFKKNNKDLEIYLSIIKFNPDVLEFADESLRNDFELMDTAVSEWGISALKYASDKLKDDKYLANLAIEYTQEHRYGLVLEHVSEKLRSDIVIVEKAMTWCLDPESSEEFKYASEEIKNNKMFILEQLELFTQNFHDPKFIQYISDELKNDADFTKELVNINPNSAKYI
jgi:hypothetical protein